MYSNRWPMRCREAGKDWGSPADRQSVCISSWSLLAVNVDIIQAAKQGAQGSTSAGAWSSPLGPTAVFDWLGKVPPSAIIAPCPGRDALPPPHQGCTTKSLSRPVTLSRMVPCVFSNAAVERKCKRGTNIQSMEGPFSNFFTSRKRMKAELSKASHCPKRLHS